MKIKRVIIADDHKIVRMGIIQILRSEYPAIEINEVGDGRSLIKEIALHDYDLVVSDLDMPELNGLEALEQIKLIRPNLPVIILSLYPYYLYAARVLQVGAFAYINKNETFQELLKAINQIELGRKYISMEISETLLSNESDKNPHEFLSNREFEIFKLLAEGKTITQIAERYILALTTISTHRGKILHKLNLTTNSDLTRYAISHHLI